MNTYKARVDGKLLARTFYFIESAVMEAYKDCKPGQHFAVLLYPSRTVVCAGKKPKDLKAA